MSRIKITCSKEDKESLLRVFKIFCPFNPYPKGCGEDACCKECIENNIKFEDESIANNCFVLRPDKDPAARKALIEYAIATKNEKLREDLLNWIQNIGSKKNR